MTNEPTDEKKPKLYIAPPLEAQQDAPMQVAFNDIVDGVAGIIAKGIEQGVSEYLSHPGREREERLAQQLLQFRDANTKERQRFSRLAPLFIALQRLSEHMDSSTLVTGPSMRKKEALVEKVVGMYQMLSKVGAV